MSQPRSIARTTEEVSINGDELSIHVCVSYRSVTHKSPPDGVVDALDGEMPFRMSGGAGKVQHSTDERVAVTVEEKSSGESQTFELSLNAFRAMLELAGRVGLRSLEPPGPIARDFGHAVIPRYR